MDKILTIFCNKNRKNFERPSMIGDMVYATDNHCLIRVPKTMTKEQYGVVPDFPKGDKVFPELNCSHIIDVDELRRIINEVPKERERVPCKDCEGDGYLECDLGHSHECETCNGDGKILSNTDILVIPDNADVYMDEIIVSAHLLEKLLHAFDAVGSEKLMLVSKRQFGALLFHIGDVEVLIMPKTTVEKNVGAIKLN